MEKDFTQTSEVAILLDTTNKYTEYLTIWDISF